MTCSGKVHRMLQLQTIFAGLFLLVIVLTNAATAQQSASQVSAGTLTCDIAPGVALIVDSPKNLRCVLYKSDGSKQAYGGRITGGGLNVGVTGRSVAAWSVISNASPVIPNDLSGRYSGVQAGAAIGVGGTNSSILSSANKAVSLQPLTVEARSGVNFALGATQMDLTLLGAPRQPATAGPAPTIPRDSYERQPQAPERVTPDYACGPETRLQASQTLFGLAKACGVSLGALLEANPGITNVRNVSVGAAISVPRRKRASKIGRCDKRTIVKTGQTAAAIASRCGVSTTSLARANPGIEGGRGVVPGQVLDIPDPRDIQENVEIAVAQPSPPERASEEDKAVEADEPRPAEQIPTPAPVEDVSEPDPVVEKPEPAPVEESREAVPEAPGRPPEQQEVALLPGVKDNDLREPGAIEDRDAGLSEERLKARCQDTASRQFGLLVYQIIARNMTRVDDETYSVTLEANSTQATCLVDRQGQVVSVQENGIETGSLPAKPGVQEAIVSRLPDDETLVMIDISSTAETRKTGTIKGYRSTAYGFPANANETMIIALESDNDDCFFNVVNAETPYGAALFVGLEEGSRRAMIRFPSRGIYLIRPYLRETAAQKNQIANYTLIASSVERGIPVSPDESEKFDLAPSGKEDRLIQAY